MFAVVKITTKYRFNSNDIKMFNTEKKTEANEKKNNQQQQQSRTMYVQSQKIIDKYKRMNEENANLNSHQM